MSSDTLFRRSFAARLPNTNSNASIRFDLPEPLGPTTADMEVWKGPISFSPPWDLKFSSTILVMMRRPSCMDAMGADSLARRASKSAGLRVGASSSMAGKRRERGV